MTKNIQYHFSLKQYCLSEAFKTLIKMAQTKIFYQKGTYSLHEVHYHQ